VKAPNSLYANWTNSSSILDSKYLVSNFEFNQQFSGGSAGPGVTSQLSARLGVTKHLELGILGNITLGNPTVGAGGVSAHVGSADLDPDKYKSGALFQVTAGSGIDPTGAANPIVTASGSYLASRGGDTASGETDFNAGATYSNFGSFGPGSSSVPHLLTLPLLAERTWYLDPQHANSTFVEGLVAPSAALGTLGTSSALYGGRFGVGAGFTTAADNSLFTLSANAFVDLTSRGTGGGGLVTVTFGGRHAFRKEDQ